MEVVRKLFSCLSYFPPLFVRDPRWVASRLVRVPRSSPIGAMFFLLSGLLAGSCQKTNLFEVLDLEEENSFCGRSLSIRLIVGHELQRLGRAANCSSVTNETLALVKSIDTRLNPRVLGLNRFEWRVKPGDLRGLVNLESFKIVDPLGRVTEFPERFFSDLTKLKHFEYLWPQTPEIGFHVLKVHEQAFEGLTNIKTFVIKGRLLSRGIGAIPLHHWRDLETLTLGCQADVVSRDGNPPKGYEIPVSSLVSSQKLKELSACLLPISLSQGLLTRLAGIDTLEKLRLTLTTSATNGDEPKIAFNHVLNLPIQELRVCNARLSQVSEWNFLLRFWSSSPRPFDLDLESCRTFLSDQVVSRNCSVERWQYTADGQRVTLATHNVVLNRDDEFVEVPGVATPITIQKNQDSDPSGQFLVKIGDDVARTFYWKIGKWFISNYYGIDFRC